MISKASKSLGRLKIRGTAQNPTPRPSTKHAFHTNPIVSTPVVSPANPVPEPLAKDAALFSLLWDRTREYDPAVAAPAAAKPRLANDAARAFAEEPATAEPFGANQLRNGAKRERNERQRGHEQKMRVFFFELCVVRIYMSSIYLCSTVYSARWRQKLHRLVVLVLLCPCCVVCLCCRHPHRVDLPSIYAVYDYALQHRSAQCTSRVKDGEENLVFNG